MSRIHALRFLLVRALVVLAVAGAVVVDSFLVVGTIGILKPRTDDPRPVDAIVALSGEEARVELAVRMADLGLAPTLVVVYGDFWSSARSLCGRTEPVEILCLSPDEDSTHGEARLVGELSRARGWESIAVVTGDYHVQRARLLIDRCLGPDVDLDVVAVDWGKIGIGLIRSELEKYVHALVIDRHC